MDDAQEKQHDATPKKIDDLKREGTVLRSKEFTSGLMIISGILTMISISGLIGSVLYYDFIVSFKSISDIAYDTNIIRDLLTQFATKTLLSVLPLFLVVYLTVLGSVFLFGGWNMTMQAVHFKISRLNPIKNLGNIYSPRIFFELTRSLFKVALFISVLYMFVKANLNQFFLFYNHKVSQSIVEFIHLIEKYIVLCIISIIVVAGVDLLYSWFRHKSKTKMSTQEVKDEHKEVEGNPQVKKKIKSMQLSILRNNIMKVMSEADVVIVNPTHYAIALAYDDKKDNAPRVVAKGKDHLAAYIRSLATKRSLPIYHEPKLARAIYRTSKVGGEINPSLYMAVAIVLSYLHQLKLYQQGVGEEPVRQYDLQIPPELHFND